MDAEGLGAGEQALADLPVGPSVGEVAQHSTTRRGDVTSHRSFLKRLVAEDGAAIYMDDAELDFFPDVFRPVPPHRLDAILVELGS